MSEKREKFGRAFKLTMRQGEELSLNTSPEKAGHERVKCADVAITFAMKGGEIKKLDAGLESMWTDDGLPLLQDLKAPIQIGAIFKGSAELGSPRGKPTNYGNARLLDFRVTPVMGNALEVRARLRVYLEHETDELYDLVIAGMCVFSFAGKLVVKSKGGDEDPDGEQLEL